MSSIPYKLNDKVNILKRRRDFLSKRIMDYRGSNDSRDRAEESALNFAIIVIEENYQASIDVIARLTLEKEYNNERL